MAGQEHEQLTWELYNDAAKELTATVKGSGFEPDILLGIARGGMFLATSLAYMLDSKALYLVNVEYYEGVDQRMERPVILPPQPDLRDLTSKKVLLVDDVADTGYTLKAVADLVAAEVAEVKIVTLYTKPHTVIQPDFAWRSTDRWIDFPWSE